VDRRNFACRGPVRYGFASRRVALGAPDDPDDYNTIPGARCGATASSAPDGGSRPRGAEAPTTVEGGVPNAVHG